MRRNIVYSFVLLIMVLGLGACKTKKGMVKKEERISKSLELIKKVSEQQIEYSNIEIKYSTRAEIEDNKQNLSITYRNRKDELIWISARAMLGIEVMRLVANHDSVWLISRVGRIKEKGTWKEMSETIGYPLDFIAIQNMMVRKIFYPGSLEVGKLNTYLRRDDGKKVLIVPDYQKEDIRKDAASFGFLPQFVLDAGKGRLLGTKLVPEDNQWMLEVKYEDNDGENMGLGSNILIKALDSQSNMDIDLKIQHVTVSDEMKYPFQWF